MKRRPSDWLKIVNLYVDVGVPMTKLAEKYHFNVSHLKHKVNVSFNSDISNQQMGIFH